MTEKDITIVLYTAGISTYYIQCIYTLPLVTCILGPVHVRRYDPQGSGRLGQVMDDYEEELRAFSRKREWEREREKHKKRPSVSPSCSEDEKSRGSGSQLKRKRHKKLRSKNKGTLPNDSEGSLHTCIRVI